MHPVFRGQSTYPDKKRDIDPLNELEILLPFFADGDQSKAKLKDTKSNDEFFKSMKRK